MGNLEEGSSTGDFENWMKGALGIKQLSLKRLSAGGLRGSSFTGDPGRYVTKVSGYGYLPSWGPPRGTWYVGARIPGTLIDEWRALVVGHLSARDSIKMTLREVSFTRGNREMMFL